MNVNKRNEVSEPMDERAVAAESIELRYSSGELFRGRQEIVIEHAGQSYRLRITRQDKLILTK